MPHLSRIHFASIGHPDARLAPLHLDLRGEGGPVDSLLWLRNGGGKSSILNLFYSLFRPGRREFLGGKAEAKARHLEEYVQGSDLAAVVTEWQTDAAAGLFPGMNSGDRLVVGQALAWRGGRVSRDHEQLKKVFFSFRGGFGLELDALPLQGLAGSVGSLEALKDWLSEAARHAPRAEIVTEEQYKRWGEHLDRLGLDPELFRYQVEMNQREGAADEQFRFATPEEFVRFFLKLTSETHRADELTAQLETLRGRLELKPAREVEKQFLAGAVGALSQLAHTVSDWARAQETEGAARAAASALAAGLAAEQARLTAEQRGLESRAEADEQTRVAAHNEGAKRSRWARGLRRKAATVRVEELKAEIQQTAAAQRALDERMRALTAAQALGEILPLRARQEELTLALSVEESSRAPLIAALEEAGGWLATLLDAEIAGASLRLGEHTRQKEAAQAAAKGLRAEAQSRSKEEGRLEGDIGTLQERLTQRDRERQRLLTDGLLLQREPVSDALRRVEAEIADIALRSETRRGERSQAVAHVSRAQQEERRLQTELTTHAATLAEVRGDLKDGLTRRDRLRGDRLLQSIEETSEPNVLDPGLSVRLRASVTSRRARLLDLGVDGAEDARALKSIEAGGLLPPSRDGERLVGALDDLGVRAYTAFEWLARNIPRERRRQIILQDPARYAGVIVQQRAELEAIDGLGADLAIQADLDGPVQISLAAAALEGAQGEDVTRRVIPPATDGAWDVDAATARRGAIEARQSRREHQIQAIQSEADELQALAQDVERFQGRFGGSRLQELEASVDAMERLSQDARQGISDAQQEQARLQRRLAQLDEEIAALGAEREREDQSLLSLRTFERTYEAPLAAWRKSLELAQQQLAQLREELRRLEVAASAAQERADRAQTEVSRAERDIDALQQERASVRQGPREDVPPDLQLSAARERFHQRQRRLERELSKSNLAGQLQALDQELDSRERKLAQLFTGLDLQEIRTLADLGERRLETEHGQARGEREALTRSMGRLETDLAQAEADVQEQNRLRRDADDLPQLALIPETSTELKDLAQGFEREAATCSAEESAAAERVRGLKEGINTVDRRAQLIQGQEERLLDAAGVVGDAAPAAVPRDDEALRAEVNARIASLKEASTESQSREARARQRAEAVRTYAGNPRFSAHRSQVKERLQDSPEVLMDQAGELLEGIQGRQTVVEEELASITRDQDNLVASLDSLGNDALRLLARAEAVSALPEGLGEWSGRPYLKIQVNVPKAAAERQALLTHMVSEMVRKGTIPSGATLLQAVAESLAGHQGFKVTILKPDAALRPSRLPITDMTAFSRGQQLTAAILLYCTLVKLRARTRGRAPSGDAGSLVLDNPIGTCSSVPLLELQRTFARKLGVQLVYTTGVRDLDALATLPNVIRLRNTHQDRHTGNQHVTVEGDESLEAVRIVHKEGA